MPEPEIHFRTTEEYERLREIRDRNGVTWRGMLLQGAKQLEGHDLRNALVQLDPALVEQVVRETDGNSDGDASSDGGAIEDDVSCTEDGLPDDTHRGDQDVGGNNAESESNDPESSSMVDLDGLDLELPREMLVSTVTGGEGGQPGTRRRSGADWNETGTHQGGR